MNRISQSDILNVFARLLFMLLLLLAAPVFATSSVGVSTLVAGPVWRMDASGERESMHANTRVNEGDRIVTGAGGLVHLRFDDGAHVGLRESSELQIVAYRSEPAAIEFELKYGTLRQISGMIARRAPESFRLKTPIASIGVRGTDFIAGMRDNSTYALLLEGAIIVRPAECAGGCGERLLSTPHTLAMVDSHGGVQTRSVAPEEIQQLIGNQRLVQGKTGNAQAAAGSEGHLRNTHENMGGVISELDKSRLSPSLVWVRWLATGSMQENFTKDLALFPNAQDYKMRLGNLNFLLWRKEPAGSSWQPGQGEISFALGNSVARYTDAINDLPLTIESGRLNLSFADRGFSTELTGKLASETVPRGLESLAESGTLINMAGEIGANGRLIAITPQGKVLGVLSLDNQTAAYLFSRVHGIGQVEGITEWKR